MNEDNPTIRGTVFDNEKVIRVSVEGRSINLSSSNQFSFKRYVPRIGADITIEATDEWGNTATKVVHLTRKMTETAAITYAALDPTRTSAKINPNAVALITGCIKAVAAEASTYTNKLT